MRNALVSFLSHSSHRVFTSVENPSSSCLGHGDAAEGLSPSPRPIQPTPSVLICISSSSQNQLSLSLPPSPHSSSLLACVSPTSLLFLDTDPDQMFPSYRKPPLLSPQGRQGTTSTPMKPQLSLVCCIASLLPIDKHLGTRLDPLLPAWAGASTTSLASPPNHLTLDNSMPLTCPLPRHVYLFFFMASPPSSIALCLHHTRKKGLCLVPMCLS